MVNILSLDAAVMVCKGKIAEDGGTAELLCSSISHTAYVTLLLTGLLRRNGEWREKSKGKRED